MSDPRPDSIVDLAKAIEEVRDIANDAKTSAKEAIQRAEAGAPDQHQESKETISSRAVAWFGVIGSVVAIVTSSCQTQGLRTQIDDASKASRSAFLAQFQSSSEALYTQFEASEVLLHSQIVAPDCDIDIDLTPTQLNSIQAMGEGLVRVMSNSYEQARVLEFSSEWARVCGRQKEFLSEHCHLASTFSETFLRSPENFQKGYETCSLAQE